ncbi:MAG TPA: amino acid racemase [Chitinophagaceae bacterium]|nr:amino acid racemase [Chitinophagaceae bacterium]
MKTIGIVGGFTWLSTMDYYRLLNQAVNRHFGGVTSAKIILYSVDFEQIKTLVERYDWAGIAGIVVPAAVAVQGAGADCIVLAANTPHNIAEEVKKAVNIPLIHIGEATAQAVADKGITKVALLGTKYTTQLDFYKDKLAEKNITTIIPCEEDIQFINASIFNEMGKGIFLPETKAAYVTIINKLVSQGAEGIVLGCTEIPILIKPEEIQVPAFDTTAIHVDAIMKFISS